MTACVIHGAKELKIENRPEPRPQEGEVLVRFGAGGFAGPIFTIITKGGSVISRCENPWFSATRLPERSSKWAPM